jgi:hypothetical protein
LNACYYLNYTSVEDAKRGVHVLRAYFAYEFFNRRPTYAPKEYERDGIMMVHNISEHAKDIAELLKTYPIATSKNDNNLITRTSPGVLIDTVIDSILPILECARLGMSPASKYNDEGNIENNTFVQRLHNKNGDGDVQKSYHMDTFFPCFKFWYFPEAVGPINGPFIYAKGSHILTEDRLQWIYEQSINIAEGKVEPWRTYGHAEGSFRISEDELKKMGLELSPIEVPENTLVIANVFGFHGRGESSSEGFRNSIHGSIRTSQPFR